jgi:hypothetical protein
MATATPPPSFFQQQQQFPQRFQTPPAQTLQASAVPDWAVDFQRLNLSTPSPVQSIHQNERQAPMSYNTSAPMMQNHMVAEPLYGNPMFDHVNNMSMIGAGYGPGVGMGYMPGEQQGMLDRQAQAAAPVFDEAAFAAAFDSAADFLQQPETKQEPISGYREEIDALMRSDEELDAIMAEYHTTDTSLTDKATFEINQTRSFEPNVRSGPILEEASKKEQDQIGRDDGDALARTAGELLDSVSHDLSDKFAHSSFMALMRSLRDKEVKVDGENFVEVSTFQV